MNHSEIRIRIQEAKILRIQRIRILSKAGGGLYCFVTNSETNTLASAQNDLFF